MFMRNDYTLEIGRVSTVKIKKKMYDGTIHKVQWYDM